MEQVQKFIQELFDKINVTDELYKMSEIGNLKKSYNDNIHIYESNHELIETIIITDLAQNNLKKISFTGDLFRISLLDLRILFGAYEIAYNYRDNYTGFFFLNTKGKKISKVSSERNNKIVKEKERFFEYSQKSKLVSSFSEKEIIFNNIIFEVHIS